MNAGLETLGAVVGGTIVLIARLAVFVGVWAWILFLLKKGPRALIGYGEVVVAPFENVLVYRNGSFDRILPPGVHWIRDLRLQSTRVDMRPEVFHWVQGVVTSDNVAATLRYTARFQVSDPRAAVEHAQNYRADACTRLQSVAKSLGEQRTFTQLQLNHGEFNAVAQQSATQALRDVGCECIAFELIQTDISGAVPNPEATTIGFGPH